MEQRPPSLMLALPKADADASRTHRYRRVHCSRLIRINSASGLHGRGSPQVMSVLRSRVPERLATTSEPSSMRTMSLRSS